MAIDQEFKDQYKQLLIIQYYDQEKAAAEIDLMSGTWSKVYDFFSSFFDEFDIDKAYGHRLDIIGKIVGINRIVENIIPKPYFGWEGGIAPFPQTFNEGPLFDEPNDKGYTSSQLNDSQMRLFIKAKIAKNITSAYLSNDERVTLQETIMFLFDSLAYVIDNFDMSLTIYIDDDYDLKNLGLLTEQNLLPKPQGVRYADYVIVYNEPGTFGFAENPNATTFGMGKFAELLPI